MTTIEYPDAAVDDSAMACPVMHTTPDAEKSFVVVVEQGKSAEDGVIVSFSSTLPMKQFRQSVAAKLKIADSEGMTLLSGQEGSEISDVRQLLDLKVAYVQTSSVRRAIHYVKGYPVVGIIPMVIHDIRDSLTALFGDHDTIQFYMFSTRVVATRDPAVVSFAINDSAYIYKKVKFPFSEVQQVGGTGLFTTSSTDPQWQLAHRLLMPAFSASAMKIYNEEMIQIAMDTSNLVSQYTAGESIDIMTLTTNVTFQAIGRVGMGYDFKLLESKDAPMSPFLIGMNYCLGQVKRRIIRSAYWKRLPLAANYRFDVEMEGMKDTVRQVIEERRQSSEATSMKKDILGFMLNAKAPNEHGELVGLSDENICDQVITLGIAGSETSANTLGWCLYLLDKHPKVQSAVLQELVDHGIKPDVRPEAKQLNKLKYLMQTIKETLRLFPPVNNIDKHCEQDCVLPGGYPVEAGTTVKIHAWSIHRNPRVYPNADKFDPDRFSEENIKKIPDGAYVPFSGGARACIGQSLALMELRAVLAVVLCKYKFSTIGDKTINYDPAAITTRPLDLFMTVSQRTEYPEPRIDISAALAVGLDASSLGVGKLSAAALAAGDLPKVTVAFGSNMGASEDYAMQMSEQLQKMGFPHVTLTTLDDWDIAATASSGNEPRPLVIVITSTYNGVPPDNAGKFAKFLEAETRSDVLNRVDYLVFGTGNSMWRTFQKFPRYVFERLGGLGATPLAEFQYGDSNDDLEEDYMQWSLRTCAMIATKYGSSSESFAEAVVAPKQLPFNVKLVDGAAASPFRISSENAAIKVNQELQDVDKSGRSTRHIEITLDDSAGISYQTGDHLNVYPVNRPSVVRETAAILGLDLTKAFVLEQVSDASRFSRSAAGAVQGSVCSVSDALQYVCDWKEAPSRELVAALSEISGNDAAYDTLRKAADDVNTLGKQSPGWNAFVADTRTVLDVLRRYAPLVRQIPLATILHYVSAMAPRRYSIASCQQVVGNEVHLSVAIVDDAINGRSYGGLTTEYLASLEPGARISVSHRPAQASFHLPPSPDTPAVFIGAGTGIAPFRGFLQEMNHAGAGGASLYFGCRSPEYDYLYKDELDGYVKDGTLVKLQPAFSRIGDERKYVQHHIAADSAKIWELLNNQKAHVYVCGSASRLAKDVVGTMLDIFMTEGCLSSDNANDYLADLVASGRYVEDVW